MVTVNDDVIVGFDEHRLVEALGLHVAPSMDGTEWLAGKYEAVFHALGAAVQQLGQARIDTPFPQRRMTVRAHALHITSFAEGGWLTHRCGHFRMDDMLEVTARCEGITTVDAICDYTDRVRSDIASYLRSAEPSSLDRIVSSHYGGEVPVIEVIRIMLRHSAHHLRQLEWFKRSELDMDVDEQLSTAVDGITVPEGLFTV